MPAKPPRPSIWDQDPALAASVLSVQVLEPTDTGELRRWARTALYDRAAAAADADRLSDELAAEVRADYLARTNSSTSADPPDEEPDPILDAPPNPTKSGSGRSVFVVVKILLLILIGFELAARAPWWVLSLYVLLTLFLVWIMSLPEPPSTPSRPPKWVAWHRLRRRRCADCGTDLEAAASGLPANRIGVNVGPRACPECGAPWPLVPPSPTPTTGVYPRPAADATSVSPA